MRRKRLVECMVCGTGMRYYHSDTCPGTDKIEAHTKLANEGCVVLGVSNEMCKDCYYEDLRAYLKRRGKIEERKRMRWGTLLIVTVTALTCLSLYRIYSPP